VEVGSPKVDLGAEGEGGVGEGVALSLGFPCAL